MKYLNNKSEAGKGFDVQLSQISPFELKNRLIDLADESVKKMAHIMLNAGRGNPNWVATGSVFHFRAIRYRRVQKNMGYSGRSGRNSTERGHCTKV